MFKRLFWLTTGASLGFFGSFWLTRRIRQTVERLMPERLSADLKVKARSFGTDVKAAVADGRDAMQAREAALRTSLETRRSLSTDAG